MRRPAHSRRAASGQGLQATALTIGYHQRVSSERLNVQISEGSFAVMVNPNECGKSTLLRAWPGSDEAAAADAMVFTGVNSLSGRLVEEPTTFLATAHQIELVEDMFGMTGRIL